MSYRTLLIGVAGMALAAGCQTPGSVVDNLPSPLVPRRPEPSPTAEKPTPTPSQPPGPTRRIAGANIVVDAGHGGKDPGAWKGTRSTIPEKMITLDIAQQVQKNLQARGANVVMTRTGDSYPSLDDRANLAERTRADLFVSIHADSAKRVGAAGVGVHVFEQASIQSRRAADCVVRAVKRNGLTSRGMFRSNLHVLREHSRPAMLIETGFLTNPGDALKLNTPSYRERLAEVIAEGIADYFTR